MNIKWDISDYWRKCTTCKKPIDFGKKYWICSVSTCNRVRTDLVFCDLRCFDAHVPVLNHRDAGAFERRAPLVGAVESMKSEIKFQELLNDEPTPLPVSKDLLLKVREKDEILVVVSKVKDYIRSRAEMNTSGSVMEVLSCRIRQFVEEGIENAKKAGRQTILERDISKFRM